MRLPVEPIRKLQFGFYFHIFIRKRSGKTLIGHLPGGELTVPAEKTPHGYSYDTRLTTAEFIDASGQIVNRLGGVNGNVGIRKRSDGTLSVPIVDIQADLLTAFTDFEGNLIAPVVPNLMTFKTFSGDNKSREVLAMPLDKERKYFLPVRSDGTAPLEPLPIKGYLTPYSGFRDGTMLDYWLKEYETENGPAFGWAAPDLSEETGPKWKSIGNVKRGFPLKKKYEGALLDHNVLVGQLLDGSWMGYDSVTVEMSAGDKMQVFKPLIDTPQPTQAALFTAVTPIYTERGDNSMAQAQAQAVVYNKWKEQMKSSLGCKPQDDLYSDACKLQREYKEAIGANDHSRAYDASRKIGGDHFIEYLIGASERKIFAIEPERFLALASSAKSPELAAKARKRYQTILDERKRAAEDAKRAAEAARLEALKPKPAPVVASQPAWSGSSMSPASWAASLGQMPAGIPHQQRMDNYIRDYKTWSNGASSYKPISPY